MRTARQGFSLIEALVALTIASLTLMAIFELQLQMARGQRRAMRAIAESALQENALALTRNLNPMDRPQGELTLPDGAVVRWTSDPKGEPVQNAGFPAGQGAYLIQRYTVTVSVRPSEGPAPAPLTFDRIGWRRNDLEF